MSAWTKDQPNGNDSHWQTQFEMLRMATIPVKGKKMVYRSPSSRKDREIEEEYHGETQYFWYCKLINDILRNIRRGEVDYCFFIYQIEDLLKFEKERLAAEWMPESGCFKLYLK